MKEPVPMGHAELAMEGAGNEWRRWLSPFGLSVAFVYGAQLTPLFAGPLRECPHCVVEYLKGFVVTPGLLLGHVGVTSLPGGGPQSEWLRFLLPGVAVTIALIAAATVITAAARGLARTAWLTLLAVLSGLNALTLAALLRS
jgi:hypothetical protein